MIVTPGTLLLLLGAGALAGAVNAAAGGGSLISFPALMLVGLPSLSANVTNTVALSFGYAGGVAGFSEELRVESNRVRRLGICAGVGALLGVVLLQLSSPKDFRALVPWLLLIACCLLAAQPLAARRLRHDRVSQRGPTLADIAQILAGIYGAYFGAGLGVMVLALLGIATGESLSRLNALKSAITLIVNAVAAVCFALIAPVSWLSVAIVGPASLIGGRLGAELTKYLPADVLRTAIVGLGIVVSVVLLTR